MQYFKKNVSMHFYRVEQCSHQSAASCMCELATFLCMGKQSAEPHWPGPTAVLIVLFNLWSCETIEQW